MTSHVARLYAASAAVVVFFVAWAAIAAHPWTTTAKPDPALAALAAREQRIRTESAAVQRLLAKRWAAYRVALAARQKAIAARKAALASVAASVPAPAAASAAPVRVVTLPPLTITRTS
jgi:hypothetical protein